MPKHTQSIKGGGDATLFIAASDATAKERSAADYLCDGTADDVQINAAIQALSSTGGTIRLSTGTFLLAAAIVFNQDSINIIGSGLDATYLKPGNNTNINGIEYTGETNIIFCSVRDLTLLGNRDNNTSGYGMYFKPTGAATFWDFLARDVWLKNWSNDGFYSSNGHGFVLDHVLAEYNDGNGINIEGTEEIEIINATYLFNGLSGILCKNTNAIITGNEIGANDKHGIEIVGNGAVVSGNEIHANSWTTNNTYDDVNITGNYNKIVNNNITGSAKSRYGIKIESGSKNTLLNNIILENATGSISDSGTSTTSINDGVFKTFNGTGANSIEINGNVIKNNSGHLYLNYGGSGYTQIGDADESPTQASSNDDLYVSGKLEVKANTYLRAYTAMDNTIQLKPGAANAGIAMGADSAKWGYTTGMSANYTYFGLGNNKRQLVVLDIANVAKDHDHPVQTNPTLFINSAKDPDIDNTEWISFAHNQTDGVIGVGKGALSMPATLKVGSTTLTEANVIALLALL